MVLWVLRIIRATKAGWFAVVAEFKLNWDSLKSETHETGRIFSNKTMEYPKEKIIEHKANR
jgi:hypothetical protein